MTAKETYQIWAPSKTKWTDWVRPVPFIGIDHPEQIHELIDYEIPSINYIKEVKNNTAIMGIIFDWSQNDVYYGIKDKGAFCDGKPIHVSECNKLNNSIISFCLTSHYNEKHIKEVLDIEGKLASKVRGLRLIVSAAIELAWCASGKIEGCLNVKPSIGLSSAAGKLLVQEAGGMVTNLNGDLRENIDTMLVTNGKIHEEIVSAIK